MYVFVLSFAVLLISGSSFAAPEDLEKTFQTLKEAESKKDITQIKKLAAETCALARQVTSAPAPAGELEKQAWSERVARARAIEVHTEYALYAAAVQSPPATTIDLLSALERQNPKSRYLDEAYGRYFLALTQTGAASKIPEVAARAIANLPDNEDALLMLADTAMNRRQSDRAAGYAERLIAVLNRHPKPEGMSAADWERKRSSALGRAHWIAGLVHSEKTQYFEADKDLRAALPLIKGNDAMMAAALFHLGVANYQLGAAARNRARVLEAAKFSDQAAAIPGPLAQQAWRNAQVMKTEAGKMR
ncbi:MAG: hypothetical protein M1541_16715 [Acidobacteria bacterium]|nr:hypothetical protein [Acidobacteriota bacterium]